MPEIELAFTILGGRDLVQQLPFVDADNRRKVVISVYYDTPDQLLAKANWSIRTRSIDDKWLQTVKGPTIAGQREEFEVEIENEQLDTEELRKTPIWQVIGLNVVNLQKVFRTNVVREVHKFQDDIAVVEVSTDQGQIQTYNGKTTILDEVELELKEGLPEDLFRIANQLARKVKLRLQPDSKAQRGYKLLSDGLLDSSKDQPIKIAAEMTTADAFRETARSVITHLITNLSPAYSGSVEGVHQGRVSLRRLRALFLLYEPILAKEITNVYDAELRKLGASFGFVRDWDVFLKDIIQPAIGEISASRHLGLLTDIVSDRRDAALLKLQEEIDSPRFTNLIISILGWINGKDIQLLGMSGLSDPIIKQMPRLLSNVHNKAKKRLSRISDNDEAMHDFRKAMKKMRYAVEYSESLWDSEDVANFIKPCKTLQTRLGHTNDAVMGQEIVRKILHDEPCIAPVAFQLLVWLRERKNKADKKAKATLKKFDSARPYWK